MTKPAMQIYPVRTEEDHRAAIKRIEQLMCAAPNTPDEDELEILITLVDVYETEHYPIAAPDPISAIQFRMDQQQLTRKDLESMIGSRARVSEVLSGKRPLTLTMVRRLKEGLGISADLLIPSAPQHQTQHSGATASKTKRPSQPNIKAPTKRNVNRASA